MRIISANLNGIRSAARKGFFDWLQTQAADILCIQETKAKIHQLSDPIFSPPGYHHYFHDAQRPGYSGVALYTRHLPEQVHYGLGWPVADDEGRYVQADFKNLSVASLYMPSGTSGDARQTVKYDFMAQYEHKLKAIINSQRPFIICGDWNIAHKKIDLKNWRANQDHSGFLPAERAWMDHLFNTIGFVDAFRLLNQEAEQYTWWSYRSRSWENNIGWRIDYHIITPNLADAVKSVSVYTKERFSDHAPLIIDYDLTWGA